MRKNRKQAGFSLIELVLVVVIVMVIAGMAIPSFMRTMQNFRTSGDALSINGEVLLAKMRAAARFTRTRVYFDLGARTFRTQWWNRDPAVLDWVDEGVGAPQNLARGVIYDFSGAAGPPPNTQTVLGQAAPCTNDTGGNPGAGADIAETACIMFNSRGFPVDSTGAPTGEGALYVTDGSSIFAVTLSATGLTTTWRTDTAVTNWFRR